MDWIFYEKIQGWMLAHANNRRTKEANMTHEEFKKLEQFQKFRFLEEHCDVYIRLYRCPKGGGEIIFNGENLKICETRADIISYCEHLFLTLYGKD